MIPLTFQFEPMGRIEIFHTFPLLAKIEGQFTHEFVTYVYETQDWAPDSRDKAFLNSASYSRRNLTFYSPLFLLCGVDDH
jgi:hypothetical protein